MECGVCDYLDLCSLETTYRQTGITQSPARLASVTGPLVQPPARLESVSGPMVQPPARLASVTGPQVQPPARLRSVTGPLIQPPTGWKLLLVELLCYVWLSGVWCL